MGRYKNTGKSDEFTVTFGGSQLFTIDVSEYRSYCKELSQLRTAEARRVSVFSIVLSTKH